MGFLRFPLALPIFHPVTLCRARSPELDPFAIRRSQTTGVNWALYRHEVTRCRARSPEALASMPSVLNPFAIRRSQTTEVEIRLFLPYLRSTCARPPSVGQDRLILTCLPSVLDLFANNWHVCQLFGDRKLQALIGPSIDMKVRRSLMSIARAGSRVIKVR